MTVDVANAYNLVDLSVLLLKSAAFDIAAQAVAWIHEFFLRGTSSTVMVGFVLA